MTNPTPLFALPSDEAFLSFSITETADRCRVAEPTLRDWSRLNVVRPTVGGAGRRGDRARRYSPAEVAAACIAGEMRRFGIPLDIVGVATHYVLAAEPSPGWSGWLVLGAGATPVGLLSSSPDPVVMADRCTSLCGGHPAGSLAFIALTVPSEALVEAREVRSFPDGT